MDRTATIIRFQWRAYWRSLSRRGKVTAGNQGVVLLILALVFVRYLLWLRVAAANLSQGKTAFVEALLAGLFLAWWFPLAGSSQASVATRRELHLPLSLNELFRVRVISLLMPPSSWIVVGASLAILYPLAHAPRPIIGIVAALLLFAMSGLIGLTLSQLISIASWRRLLVTVAPMMAGAVGLYALSGRSLLQLATFLPSTLVARAAVGQHSWIGVGILAALCALAYGAALGSFRLSLQASRSHSTARRLSSFRFAGRLGGLLAKDVRYFRRLLDVYLALVASAAGCIYLVSAEAPSRGIFLTFISIVFFCNAAIPFNGFGLDTRAGLSRYSLFPLTGRSILLSKNLAYLLVMSGEVLPLILLAGWRFGWMTSAMGILEAAALACLRGGRARERRRSISRGGRVCGSGTRREEQEEGDESPHGTTAHPSVSFRAKDERSPSLRRSPDSRILARPTPSQASSAQWVPSGPLPGHSGATVPDSHRLPVAGA